MKDKKSLLNILSSIIIKIGLNRNIKDKRLEKNPKRGGNYIF